MRKRTIAQSLANLCPQFAREMAGSSSSGSLPVDDIAKAVSGAVSSILSKLQNRNQEEAERKPQQAVSDPSSADEFQPVAPSQKRRRKMTKQK